MNTSVWVAEADTPKIHDCDVFQSPEGAKAWLEQLRAEYHPEFTTGKWFESKTGGTWKQKLSMAEFTYDLREVKP